MIVGSGVVIVMVAVERLFERRRGMLSCGRLGDGEVMMPLGQVKRGRDKARPRKHQPQKGQSRGGGSKTTHSHDAMSRVSITTTVIHGFRERRGRLTARVQAVVKANAMPWLPLVLRQFAPIIVHATPAWEPVIMPPMIH